MVFQIKSIIVLVALALTGVNCKCKEHSKPCKSLQELSEETNCFTEWSHKKCPDNKTIIDKKEIDEYKKCITTHLKPCLEEDKEDAPLKKIFIDMLDKFDLTHVCTDEVSTKIEHELIDVYMDHKAVLEKRAGVKCSVLKEAMNQVIKCAHIK